MGFRYIDKTVSDMYGKNRFYLGIFDDVVSIKRRACIVKAGGKGFCHCTSDG
jgi:hypothetical protein